MKKAQIIVIIWNFVILIAAYFYAHNRYIVLNPTPINDVSFIFNKALALTSIISFSMAYIISNLKRLGIKSFNKLLPTKKYFGVYGFFIASAHILLTILIISPALHPKLFTNQELNLYGYLTIAFGALAFMVFIIPAYVTLPSVLKELKPAEWLKLQRYGYLGLLFVAIHASVWGFAGWLTPDTWPGGLIPITLIAVTFAMAALALKGLSIILKKK